MKRETVAEFLARGGVITKIPIAEIKIKPEAVKVSAGGPAILMSLDEADLYYGEAKTRKNKKKVSQPLIDISVLPEELRKKFIDGALNGQDEEEHEE
jgi:hypothetical protein